MKKKKKAKKPEIWCPYKNTWIPLGRSKKKCPYCGAVIGPKGGMSHEIRKK